MEIQPLRLWLARCLIGLVTLLNIQCALFFIFSPDHYLSGFELTGIGGKLAVQGTGLLFIMWNIPYLFALWHPVLHQISLIEAIVMQFVGLLGESIFILQIPIENSALVSSIQRFIGFDASGLVLLVLALVITRKLKPLSIHLEMKP